MEENKIKFPSLEKIFPETRIGLYKRYVKKMDIWGTISNFQYTEEYQEEWVHHKEIFDCGHFFDWELFSKNDCENAERYFLFNPKEPYQMLGPLTPPELWLLTKEYYNLRDEEESKESPIEFKAVRDFYQKSNNIWFAFKNLRQILVENAGKKANRAWIKNATRILIDTLCMTYEEGYKRGHENGFNKCFKQSKN